MAEGEQSQYQFRIKPEQRADFLRRIDEVTRPNSYIVKELREGPELVVWIFPASGSPSEGARLTQAYTELATQMDIHDFKAGKADAEIDF